jgi:hypothetical protein
MGVRGFVKLVSIFPVVVVAAGGCVTNSPLLPPCPPTTAYYLCTWPPDTATEATCEDDSADNAVSVIETCEPKPGVKCVKTCPDGRSANP